MSRAASLNRAGELATGRPYAERSEREPGWHDRVAEFLLGSAVKPARDLLRNPARALTRIVGLAAAHETAMRAASDAELGARAARMRGRLRRDGFAPALVGESFALVREAATRTLGQRHYDPQLMGGWALLQGKLVEMETGEGKTIAATLPASTVALAGYPVHVITVNDYLAQRDAEEMAPLYGFLGLSVGMVVQGMTPEQRREAYARSVTYCSNKELAFDYLRDRVALAQRSSRLHLALDRLHHGGAQREAKLVLRGLYYGIVDEADSVFIDEARTPLILSATVAAFDEQAQCERALELAERLVPVADYTIDLADRTVTLTPAGEDRVAALAGDAGIWQSARARDEMVAQAVTALTLFRRDQHYVVADGKVQIVDELTGRIMADRAWERGLHQLIEVKEGCDPTPRRETLARLTYQRLFRRYIKLAGMTGTAREVAGEIRAVYGLDVVRIPLHRPSQRHYELPQIFATRAEKWRSVADVIASLATAGRPVLIGTRSVSASEEISAVLAARGIEHALLNAKQDQEEAEVIARAGQPSRVTVATNMAGRGTDIRLAADRAARRPACHPDRVPQIAARRPAVLRALRPPGRPRQLPGHRLAGGRTVHRLCRRADACRAGGRPPRRARSGRRICGAARHRAISRRTTRRPGARAERRARSPPRSGLGLFRQGRVARGRHRRRRRSRDEQISMHVRLKLLSRLCWLAVLTLLAVARIVPAAGQEGQQGGATFTCLIEPKMTLKLGTPVPGLIRDVLVDRGAVVKKGEVLAQLDSGVEAAAVALAKARAENDLSVQSARAKLAFEIGKEKRAVALRANDNITISAAEEAQTGAKVADFELNEAVTDQQMAQLELTRAEELLKQRTIRSPIDGVVTERTLGPGEYVFDQAHILTVAQIDPLSVEAYVPLSEYGRIHQGMPADVYPEKPIGGKFAATVTVVDKVFDAASGTIGIRLDLPNHDYALPAGLRCRVHFGA